jgi:DNA end-binding protein Ku
MARKSTARKREDAADSDQESAGEPEQSGGTPGRAIWSGSISFGLLQIPVTLYTAERKTEEIHFRLLDKKDLSPVRYERVNAQTGKPVDWKDIVKGYEIERDQFVVMDPEDLKKANVKATQTVDIQDFVPADQIDPAFFQKPYFLVPERRAQKAYVLLRRALEAKNAIAIATFVLRTREHLCAVMPVSGALMLEVLRFGHELKSASDMPLPADDAAAPIGDRELEMAEQLIDGMMRDWDPARYKDRYYRDVMKMIEEKARHGTAKQHHARMPGKVANDVVDLLDLLKQSVAKKGGAANDQKPKGGVKKATRRSSRSKKTEAA